MTGRSRGKHDAVITMPPSARTKLLRDQPAEHKMIARTTLHRSRSMRTSLVTHFAARTRTTVAMRPWMLDVAVVPQ
jgi:hypothetical protein